MQQKKIHHDWQRNYRAKYAKRNGELSFQLLLGQSDIQVVARENLAAQMIDTLRKLRSDIAAWQSLYPEFRASLIPLPIPKNAPEVVMRMHKAAMKAGVGPFAAVAGTIAQMLAEAYVEKSPDLIVENGGDIYMYSQKERVVALLADPEGGAHLGLQFEACDFPLAICASSATIGHSLSLGNGELAVVCSKDGALADAVATALGNRLQGVDSVAKALEFAQGISGVDGIFVQCGEALGVWGNMTLTHI